LGQLKLEEEDEDDFEEYELTKSFRRTKSMTNFEI